MQATVHDRTILFDLSEKEPEEIFFLNASSHFVVPQMYVEAGVKIVKSTRDPHSHKKIIIEEV